MVLTKTSFFYGSLEVAARETPSQYGSGPEMSAEMIDDEMIPNEVFFCIPHTNIDTFYSDETPCSGFLSTHLARRSSNSTMNQIFREKH